MCLDHVLRRLSVILVLFFPLLLLFCFVAAAVLVVILFVVVCFAVAVARVLLLLMMLPVLLTSFAFLIFNCKKTNGTYNQNKWHIICVMCLDLRGGGGTSPAHTVKACI